MNKGIHLDLDTWIVGVGKFFGETSLSILNFYNISYFEAVPIIDIFLPA